tara:strand:- start:419 stop:823 length:405 start_codon:yes stop_codon:yes gene_type:complete
MSFNVRENFVSEFHKSMGQAVAIPYNKAALKLRMDLILEEVQELADEVATARDECSNLTPVSYETQARILKELCDLMYVVSGFAVTFGLPVQPAFVRVHRSNMSKLVDGKPVINKAGKVMKGENYQPPTMEGLI